MKEAKKVQFRREVFNLNNTKILGQPSGNFSTSAAADSITTLTGHPRVMQFALRLAF